MILVSNRHTLNLFYNHYLKGKNFEETLRPEGILQRLQHEGKTIWLNNLGENSSKESVNAQNLENSEAEISRAVRIGKKRFFFRKRFSLRKGNRCFICDIKCHFAKKCSSKRKGKNLNQIFSAAQVDLDEEDFESLVSEEEQSLETIFVLE